jgi:hypothetical protein
MTDRGYRSHFVIPDTQCKPGAPTDHLGWVGQYLVDQCADRDCAVIHLGDHADMPSLSRFDKGRRSAENRRVGLDLDAANEGWAILNEPLVRFNKTRRRSRTKSEWWPERYITLGNHEYHIERACEEDPSLEGILSLDGLDYARTGWDVVPYLRPLQLDGVTYAHFFYNPLTGRAYGGQNIDTRLKTIGYSFTMGHQQTLMYGLRFVGGRSQHGLVAGACYLHDEAYKGPQGNAHWRGIIVCHEVEQGSYSPMFVSLNYLCKRYEGVDLKTFTKKKYPKLHEQKGYLPL